MTTLPKETRWDATNPDVLVVACSDGRFQEELDRYLSSERNITNYDRLYVPGGAGALAPSGIEFSRAHNILKECRFLIEAHGIVRVMLLFHAPAFDGPDEAVCGDYTRAFPGHSVKQIRRQQDADLSEILRAGIWGGVTLEVLRIEVTRERAVNFVRLHESTVTD